MEVDTSDVAVRCMAHGGTELIVEAVLKGWKQCSICNYLICPECIAMFAEDAGDVSKITCPGSSFGRKKHQWELQDIPIDQIMVMANKKVVRPTTGILVERAFFQTDRRVQGSLEDFDPSMIITMNQENKDDITIKEEYWANMGTVLVKRKRGKYVMWERLGNY